ncbi:MAG TPA: MauE/DoxX family redox-associated membrane protein [Burkholderiales bacterium]|nr:MauE/DoxX family redox-associated membrane protein [Burkholderiales bacterium]
MKALKATLRYLLGTFLVFAGANHFRIPEFYVSIMPAYLPWHLALVYLSGVAEVAIGVLLFFERSQRLAAWGAVALMVAVFPANLQMALHPDLYPQFSPAALWARLPAQGVLLAWAYWLTRPSTYRN